MMKSKVILLSFAFYALLSSFLISQSFSEYNYTIKDGLISDLTKSIIQDNKGFIWIATDEGAARFDGISFDEYSSRISDKYFKDFLITKSGKLLALHDMGIYEIKDNLNSVKFSSFASGSVQVSDTAIHYGKNLFEDHHGAIWVSEGNSVLRISGKVFKRFRFPEIDNSYSFLRSFQFFQDSGNILYVISYSGNIYSFNERDEKFEPVKTSYAPSSVYSLREISGNKYLVGSAAGISLITVSPGGKVTHNRIQSNLTDVSTIDERNGVIIAGTWQNGAHIANYKDGALLFSRLPGSENGKVNKIIFDSEGQIWIATERGIILLAKQDFQLIKTTEGNNYVQSLRETDRNTVLIVHGAAVFEFSSAEGSIKELYRSVNSNILSAELRNNTLYILNDIEQLLIINRDGNTKTISLYPNGIIPSSLLPDSKGNLWVVFYNSSEILKIDKDFKFSRYLASGNPELSPGKILEDENGDIYITGFSKDAILKKFDSSVQKFIPVHSGSDKSRLKVNDAEKYQNNWYFATDSGLYKLSGTTLTRLLASELNNSNFTALEFDANGSIWLGSNRGFYRIEHEKFILGFDESNGLPARTINLNSLVVQGTEVFAGTPNGAARFTSSVLSINTKKPFVILRERFIGDLFAWSDNEVNIYEGESLILSAISTSYPNKNMIYELVINGENFLREKHFNSETEFGYGLEPGNYRIYVRAKKNGNYNWSESFAFTLNIKGRWYSSWLALLLYILTAFGLIYAGSYVVSLRVRKENQKLESLVKARTEEIRHKNEILESQNSKIEKQYAELQILLEQLKESNLTKNKLFSVISHDLKNPFVALLGISELLLEDFDDLNDDEKKEFIKKINNSGRITFSLVENLLNWARSQTNRISINSSHFNLRSLYDEESAILSNLAAEKNVRILNNTDENLIVFADRHMMSSVARNIIQNAIKYSPLNGKIHINSFYDTNFAGVSVTDEGSGMTEEQVSKLFSLEKKTVTVGTFNEKGTGLGLLICKEFTEANGGEIKVESAPGSGSTFTITLPMKKSEE